MRRTGRPPIAKPIDKLIVRMPPELCQRIRDDAERDCRSIMGQCIWIFRQHYEQQDQNGQ